VTVVLRPPRRDDAEAIAAVSKEFGYASETADEIRGWFDISSHDLERDARVAVVNGTIGGYADVSDADSGGKIVWADVRAQQGAAPPLLDFVEARAREQAAAGAKIKLWAPEEKSEWRSLIESRGFEFDRYSCRMWIDLAAETPEPAWPPGIDVRTYDRDRDELAVYETHQETFSDQRDFSRDVLDDWREWSYREPFDPQLWFLAVSGDDLAGIALCRGERGGDANAGWINILGVSKPYRRRGVGLALLLHAFHELRARGKTRAGLGVDDDNPTGAARLYERAGMRRADVSVWYVKSL
jgi:mycothiol synthase